MIGALTTPINHKGGFHYDTHGTFKLRSGHHGRRMFHRRHRSAVWKGVTSMDGLANLISMLDYVLDSKRKRHITGGILLSVSLLFGGLALTVMTINNDFEEETQDE